MKTKLRAIWRIITAREYVVLSQRGLTASFSEINNSNIIRTITESIQRLQLQEEVKNEQKKKELLRNDHTSVSS